MPGNLRLPGRRFIFPGQCDLGVKVMRNEYDLSDVSHGAVELIYRSMNRKLAVLLNWLDALRTPSDFAKFEWFVQKDSAGYTQIELRHLKVWVYFDQRRYWIAQGLDVGYVAAARDVAAVKQKFMRGLATTLLLNLEKHGSIEPVLRQASPEIWMDWRRAVRAANPPLPMPVISESQDIVPGLRAPVPRLELSFYGCPA